MKGWHKESYRHYLAAKGIKTSRYSYKKVVPKYNEKGEIIILPGKVSEENKEFYDDYNEWKKWRREENNWTVDFLEWKENKKKRYYARLEKVKPKYYPQLAKLDPWKDENMDLSDPSGDNTWESLYDVATDFKENLTGIEDTKSGEVSFPEERDYELAKKRKIVKNTRLIVKDNKVVGFVQLDREGVQDKYQAPRKRVEAIAILPQHQGKGIGKEVIDDLKKDKSVDLITGSAIFGSREFWKKQGATTSFGDDIMTGQYQQTPFIIPVKHKKI